MTRTRLTDTPVEHDASEALCRNGDERSRTYRDRMNEEVFRLSWEAIAPHRAEAVESKLGRGCWPQPIRNVRLERTTRSTGPWEPVEAVAEPSRSTPSCSTCGQALDAVGCIPGPTGPAHTIEGGVMAALGEA